MTTTATTLDVRCPACLVEAGQPCIGRKGRRKRPHAERRPAAAGVAPSGHPHEGLITDNRAGFAPLAAARARAEAADADHYAPGAGELPRDGQ